MYKGPGMDLAQVELKFNSRNNTSVSVCFLKWLTADRNKINADIHVSGDCR